MEFIGFAVASVQAGITVYAAMYLIQRHVCQIINLFVNHANHNNHSCCLTI